jgi:hypothetical protein
LLDFPTSVVPSFSCGRIVHQLKMSTFFFPPLPKLGFSSHPLYKGCSCEGGIAPHWKEYILKGGDPSQWRSRLLFSPARGVALPSFFSGERLLFLGGGFVSLLKDPLPWWKAAISNMVHSLLGGNPFPPYQTHGPL